MGRSATAGTVDVQETVVLISDVQTRTRVLGGLQRQNHPVARPAHLLGWVAARRPDVVLVTSDEERDVRARAGVVRVAPETACVMLVHDPTPSRYRELMTTCTAVLPASSSEEDISVAVTGAWRDLSCLPTPAARALSAAGTIGLGLSPALEAREVAWLRALADGSTVAGLARGAGYSTREMYRLLGGLYSRLGAASRTEALLRADRLGLLTPIRTAAPTRTSAATTTPAPGKHLAPGTAPGRTPGGPSQPQRDVRR